MDLWRWSTGCIPTWWQSTCRPWGYLHTCRALFTDCPVTRSIRKLEVQQQRLVVKNPNKRTASGEFVSEMTQIVKGVVGTGGKRKRVWWQQTMRKTGAAWAQLDTEDRQRLGELAQSRRERKWLELGEDQEHVAARIQLLRLRQQQERLQGAQHFVGSNRLTAAHMETLAAEFNGLQESH